MRRYIGKSDIFYAKAIINCGRRGRKRTNMIPDNRQPWVEEIKSLKDLFYIADQVANLAEIYRSESLHLLEKHKGRALKL